MAATRENGEREQNRERVPGLVRAMALTVAAVAVSTFAGAQGESAETALERCDALYRSGDVAAATQSCGELAAEARTSGDRQTLAEASVRLGSIAHQSGQPGEARSQMEAALELFRETGDATGEGRTLNALANVFYSVGEPAQGLELAQQGLAVAERIDNLELTTASLRLIGLMHNQLGNPRRALEFLERAVPLAEELGSPLEQMLIPATMGHIYASIDRIHPAIRALEASLVVNREVGFPRSLASTLFYLGFLHHTLGEPQQALGYLFEALEMQRTLESKVGESGTRNAIALVYGYLGDDRRAHEEALLALEADQHHEYPYQRASTLELLGDVNFKLGRHEEAIARHREALELRGQMSDTLRQGLSHYTLGSIHLARGELEEAITAFETSRATHAEYSHLGPMAQSLLGLAKALGEAGRLAEAQDYAGQALALARSARDWQMEASALHLEGRILLARGELDEAQPRLERAVHLVERRRSEIDPQDLRIRFFGRFSTYYSTYVNLLMARHREAPEAGFDSQAFMVAERGRARAILDELSSGRLELGTADATELNDRQDDLDSRLSAAETRLSSLLSGGAPETEVAVIQGELEELAREQRELEARFWAVSPRFATLRFPRPLDLAELRGSLGSVDAMIAEFELGEERSYLWLVSAGGVKSYELPPSAEIEAAARRVHELLSSLQLRQAQAATRTALAELSQTLFSAAAPELSARRLLVVPDGALHFIPFSALPHPERPEERLVGTYEIAHLPSAAFLGQRHAWGEAAPSLDVAVLADPVFRSADPRVASTTATAGDVPGDDVLRPATPDLPRLPHSLAEAEAIASLVPAERRLLATGFDANRSLFDDGSLSDYRIVHLATHGFLNDREPWLSGLALSLLDRDGNARNGFLRTRDIYELDLAADLVVLSACETALGEEIDGEGVLGVTRAFLVAGARQVLVSLWRVSDRATAELMQRFYRGMLVDGMSAEEALRSAQLSMSRERRWSSPFYWAGFVLQG